MSQDGFSGTTSEESCCTGWTHRRQYNQVDLFRSDQWRDGGTCFAVRKMQLEVRSGRVVFSQHAFESVFIGIQFVAKPGGELTGEWQPPAPQVPFFWQSPGLRHMQFTLVLLCQGRSDVQDLNVQSVSLGVNRID